MILRNHEGGSLFICIRLEKIGEKPSFLRKAVEKMDKKRKNSALTLR